MRVLHVVLPNDIDDPATPSGGNAYDRRICHGLADPAVVGAGWSVRELAVHGNWPHPTPAERRDLADALSGVPDGALVLVDGLIGSAVPDVLVPAAARLRVVVLVHMPRGDAAEGAALAAAAAVVTTSEWSRRRLLDQHGLPPDRVHVATPGVDPAPLAPGSAAGSRLLCVAAVTPLKGHDVLVGALAMLGDLTPTAGTWTCECVGSLDRDPGFAGRVRAAAPAGVRFTGPRTGAGLDACYTAADLLVLASRAEAYGMVVTEALARGIPVLATAVQGVPEAVGRAPDGSLPGLLVAPDDPAALAAALRRWLGDPDLRHRLRRSARDRRATLTGWAVTAGQLSKVLDGVDPHDR